MRHRPGLQGLEQRLRCQGAVIAERSSSFSGVNTGYDADDRTEEGQGARSHKHHQKLHNDCEDRRKRLQFRRESWHAHSHGNKESYWRLQHATESSITACSDTASPAHDHYLINRLIIYLLWCCCKKMFHLRTEDVCQRCCCFLLASLRACVCVCV